MAQSSGCARTAICNHPDVSSTEPRPPRLSRWPWHPFLFAFGWVFASYVDAGVHTLASLRSTVVVLFAVGVLLFLVWWVTRRTSIAAIATTGLFAVFVSSDPVLSLWILVAIIIAIAGYLIAKGTVAHSLSADDLSGWLNVLSVALIVVIGAQGALNGTLAAAPGDLVGRLDPAVPAAGGDAKERPPDVYIIVLDGYPRADTVVSSLGGDNSGFLNALEDRGFTAADASTSGYMYTDLSFTSLFHGRHLVDIAALGPVLHGAREPSLDRQVLNAAPLLRVFREHGYSTIANAQAWDEPALRDVDIYVEGTGLNEFERHLLRSTLAGEVWEAIDKGFEGTLLAPWVRDAFRFLELAPDLDVPGPRLVFTHVPLPHFPIIFTKSGARADPRFTTSHPDQARASAAEVTQAYLDELAYLNRMTLETLDAMALPEGAIVIVMSDHGPEFGLHWFDEENTDFKVRFASLFAAKNGDGFPNDVFVTEVLAILARDLLGEPIQYPERRFFSNEAGDKFQTLKEMADPWK